MPQSKTIFVLLHCWINEWEQNAKYNWHVYNVLVNFGLVLPSLLIPQRLLINKFNGTSCAVCFKLRSSFSCFCWIHLSQKSKCLLFYGIVVLNCVCWQNKCSGDNIILCVYIYRQVCFWFFLCWFFLLSWFLAGGIMWWLLWAGEVSAVRAPPRPLLWWMQKSMFALTVHLCLCETGPESSSLCCCSSEPIHVSNNKKRHCESQTLLCQHNNIWRR